jgi:hypothetical protein
VIVKFCPNYEPMAQQRRFHDSRARYRLFGGAAGPGKTRAMLQEAAKQAHKFPGVDTLLLRRTFPELESSLIAYFRRYVPRDNYRGYNEAKHIVTWLNGSTTRFGYSAGENDVYQYQGSEFLFIGIDELTMFTLGQWQFLTSRNRCPIPEALPCMAGATNPGNIGHAWVKALWIDKRAPRSMDRPEQYDPGDYEFIPARIADGPYATDADYIAQLNALPGVMRQMFLEGDWDVMAGQYFDVFGAGNVVDHSSIEMAAWWPRWISVDWGFQHPSAVYWHTMSPDGRVVTYREMVQAGLTPRALAQQILDRSTASDGGAETIAEIFVSPDAFAHKTDPLTIAQQMDEVFMRRHGFPLCAAADDDRVGGWMLLYQQLADANWLISDSCAALIDCLPSLVRDSVRVEDVKKMDGDDPADSARYGLKSRLSPARKPAEVAAAERITAVDPTSRAIWMQKLLREEQDKLRPKKFGSRHHRHRPMSQQ